MLKKNIVYITILLALFGGIIYLEIVKPKPLDWGLYFDKKADTPYGAYLLYENMSHLFPNQRVRVANHEIKYQLKNPPRGIANYIFLNETFDPDTADTKALINWVSDGNNAFIIANYFEGELAAELGVQTYNLYSEYDYYYDEDEEAGFASYGTLAAANLNFEEFGVKADSAYNYKRNLSNFYFSETGYDRLTILGRDEFDNPNFIKLKIGSGNMYLHCLPRAFTNYFVSDPVNHEYAFKALSYLPSDATTIWDEYYKLERGPSGSPLRFLMQHDSLMWAFFIFLGTILLFTLFNAKRRQRIIPVIPPLQNTSLEFVGTIAALYYYQGNHRNLAEKKITYFLENIRNSYQMRTNTIDGAFLKRLSTRSGVPIEQVEGIFKYMDFIKGKQDVLNAELFKLNTLVDEFNELSQR